MCASLNAVSPTIERLIVHNGRVLIQPQQRQRD
jgi:hypothetical protein